MIIRKLAASILLFCCFVGIPSLVAQRSIVDLLPRQWIVGEQNRYGDVVPAIAERYGDRYSLQLGWDGRVIYTSAPTRGLQFQLVGTWECIPRERILIFYYSSRKGNDGYKKFKESFPTRRETYYVERINRGELVLRSQRGGRDFALLANERRNADPYRRRR